MTEIYSLLASGLLIYSSLSIYNAWYLLDDRATNHALIRMVKRQLVESGACHVVALVLIVLAIYT